LQFRGGPGDVALYDLVISGHSVRQGERADFAVKVKARIEVKGKAEALTLQERFLSGEFSVTAGGKRQSGRITPMTMTCPFGAGSSAASPVLVSGASTTIPIADFSVSPEGIFFPYHLSDTPVKVGQSWTVVEPPDDDFFPGPTNVTYTFLAEEKYQDRPCARLKVASTADFTQDDSDPESGVVIRIKVKYEETATVLFDYERGLVLSDDAVSKTTITETTTPAGGDPTVVEYAFDNSQRTTLTNYKATPR
jgi:hypothetical protein